MKKNKKILVIGLAFVILFSCRGQMSEKPPYHLNPNMDFQTKKKAQRLSREIPEGVIAFGESTEAEDKVRSKYLKADSEFYTGKTEIGDYVKRVPLEVDRQLLKRGQERFNIYCAVCHDQAGTSQSIIVKRGVGIPPPPELATKIDQPDGELFNTVTYGKGNMAGYATQVEVKDRWAIVAYVRALQKARTKLYKDIPESKKVYLNF